MDDPQHALEALSRRQFIQQAGALGLAGFLAGRSWDVLAANIIELPFVNGARPLVSNFPQKGPMLLLRTRPPLLETPFDVFDRGVMTPNNQFYVRWHLANIPTRIDPAAYILSIHGHVKRPLKLSLMQLMQDFRPIEIAAVNQCSGNSRGFFNPRVAGGEWGNGGMGNAVWRGVSLRDVLDRAGIQPGAVQVRFNGLDTGVIPQTPDFLKSLEVDHARDGEVMLAYAMNGKPLPWLNGFPLRLIVPGWYATYWVKMLNDIEVLNKPDTNFWMSKAYLIPDTPHANMAPGQKGVKMVPINRMVPRSFITNLHTGQRIPAGRAILARGIAFGGDTGVAKVQFSSDGGRSWQAAQLGKDYGKYSFRQWTARFTPHGRGNHLLMVKATNQSGVTQPGTPNWNPAGFMRNVIETVQVTAI